MVVLLHLSQQRLNRVGWRLEEARQFSVAIPEHTLPPRRPWDLCLVVADQSLIWDGSELVAADEANHAPSVIALARIRSSPRPTTTDDRVMIAESVLIEPVVLADLVEATSHPFEREVGSAIRSGTAALDGAAGEALVGSLLGVRPQLAQVIERLRRRSDAEPVHGRAGEILVLERDAARLALSIAGVDSRPLQEWNGHDDEGFLASLAYEAPEDVLVSHDATRFPDSDARPGGRPDWITFSSGQNVVTVGNVNKTKLENTLGVDLIYRHLDAYTFVLVQYKRMRRDASGDWFYRPDKQLFEELERMRRYDSSRDAGRSAATWRLHPRGFALKLVKPPSHFDPRSDRLLPGIYLPLEYFDELLADDCTLTKRGARRFDYDTVDRYLTSDLFVALVRQGWIGTRGITTRNVERMIDAAVGAGRSVIVAEEQGVQSGSTRRRRPARA